VEANNKEHAALKKVLHVALKKKQLAALKIMKNKDVVVDIIITMLHMIITITIMKQIIAIAIITMKQLIIITTTTITVVVGMIIATIISTIITIIILESTYLSCQNKNKKKRILLSNLANLSMQSTQILQFRIPLVMKSRVSRQEDKKTVSMLWYLLVLYARHVQLDPSQRKLTTKELCFSAAKHATVFI